MNQKRLATKKEIKFGKYVFEVEIERSIDDFSLAISRNEKDIYHVSLPFEPNNKQIRRMIASVCKYFCKDQDSKAKQKTEPKKDK